MVTFLEVTVQSINYIYNFVTDSSTLYLHSIQLSKNMFYVQAGRNQQGFHL